jgi:hypothetical protein
VSLEPARPLGPLFFGGCRVGADFPRSELSARSTEKLPDFIGTSWWAL